jgi:hypothetical protein
MRVPALLAVFSMAAASPVMATVADHAPASACLSVSMVEGDEPSRLHLATWSAGQDAGGAYIRDGSTKIYMKSYKKARRTAKKFNKMESKTEGFKADETGPCADPHSGVRC